jgi:hypothetical protein
LFNDDPTTVEDPFTFGPETDGDGDVKVFLSGVVQQQAVIGDSSSIKFVFEEFDEGRYTNTFDPFELGVSGDDSTVLLEDDENGATGTDVVEDVDGELKEDDDNTWK